MDVPRADHRAKSVGRAPTSVARGIAMPVVLSLGWVSTLVWEVQHVRSGISLPWELALVLCCAWTGGVRWGVAAAIAEAIRLFALQLPWYDSASFWLLQLALIWWVDRLRTQYWDAHRHARHDPLTGLPNRRALDEYLEAELSRAARFARPLTVGLLDCDGFKRLNDESGHHTGDTALRQIGALLRRELRAYDGVFRLGGDEFVVVLPETDQAGAEQVFERLRTSFAHEVERRFPGLTACLGVVVFASAPENAAECLQRADEAMYRAKRIGVGETVIETRDGRPRVPRPGAPRVAVVE
jgi:diguanylate cyclase (GGDEF)-like protein